MKTTINIPDKLLRRAKSAARELGISRDRLFANAVSQFLERRMPAGQITQQLNEVYSHSPSIVDPAVEHSQTELLKKVDWE